MCQDLIIGIAGAGGDGVVSAGESLITAAALEGYHGIMTKSFGSQIRGGEASCRLRLSTRPVLNPNGSLDVAVALNWEDFRRFGGELPIEASTVVIYDSKTEVMADKLPLEGVKPSIVFSVPITETAERTAGTSKAKNIVVLGLLAGWFGIGRESMLSGIRKKFGKKGGSVLEGNVRAFQAGLDFAENNPLGTERKLGQATTGGGAKLLADGNEMCATAAIFAGCTFFSGYPITPSTEIMQCLDREIWKYGGTVLQAEDEIAGLGAVVGASFAGLKAMTATSGPGMSLKTEMLGLASIAELPLVCVNVQRGGPSTGLPTKAEQSDLFQAVFSAHGDCLRPVIAPTSVADIFGMTVEAFNLAEHYQTPVILLSDQEIAQRKETVEPIDTSRVHLVERRKPTEAELTHYVRFKVTESGISPLSQPGMPGGNYLAAGIEHNESGRPTASGEMHALMNEKRFRKFHSLRTRRDLFTIEGDPGAPIGLVSWGSVAGVAMEALQMALEEGIRAKLLVPRLLYPVAEPVYQDFFASVKRGLFVEQSFQGQLFRLVRMYVDLPSGIKSLARSGSNPIHASEVLERLRELVVSIQRTQNQHLAEPVEV
ncbi:MAG TPA: 2-oxoacid:acceptor oxidoreductase subunit alpha [Verrucomicrobiae bacterium]|nr:2-oxoacid:acceptor oxidoreductase subunit alpha [Verrucomicrobiae bacterium]